MTAARNKLRAHRGNITLGATLALFSLMFLFKSTIIHAYFGPPIAAPTNIVVNAAAIPLNEEDPSQRAVGKLDYIAGWHLTSPSGHFGGISALIVENDARRLVAINDKGDWLTAKMDIEAAAPIADAVMAPFDPAFTGDAKKILDAESLIRTDGGYLVAFEQQHRLMVSSPSGSSTDSPINRHMNFAGLADNGGMEAISWTQDGKLLAFAERGLDIHGRLKGWLADADGAEMVYLKPPQNFAPTDAALMANGDVLLLMRRFSPAEGVAVKLLRIKAADIRPGAVLEGDELAHFAPPLSVDNMEGLDVVEKPGAPPLVFMISDDNFNGLQRTILMVFTLKE